MEDKEIMKNKCKKIIATLVVAITLCGSVLTVQAATCVHTAATRHSYTRYEHKTHTYGNGQLCSYKIVTNFGTTYCTTCGATLKTDVFLSSSTEHSVQH